MKPDMTKLVRLIVAFAIVGFLFANPITRSIIIFLLPLGSGIDDFVEAIAIIGLLVLLIANGWLRFDIGEVIQPMLAFSRVRELVLAALVIAALFIMPFTGNLLWGLLLYGIPIVDPAFYLILGIAVVLVVLGWAIFKWRTK